MRCRRKKPGTVANQIMRRLPPDLLTLCHRKKPLQAEGPEDVGGRSHGTPSGKHPYREYHKTERTGWSW
jgi:hypothetical protein